MAITALEACDLIRFAAQYRARLAQAEAELGASAVAEARWLAEARARLEASGARGERSVEAARALPELTPLREELAAELQGAWVDALERLHAGITFHAGSRAPVLEALFGNVKLASLRRAAVDSVRQAQVELERRMKSAYVSRVLGQEDHAFAQPVLAQLATAYAQWDGCLCPPPVEAEAASALREELQAVAAELELPLRQARLLAEAALAGVPGAYERHALGAKPKRRAAASKGLDEPTPDPVRPQVQAPAQAPEPPAQPVTAAKTKRRKAS
jgi:hypothetical protein